MIGLPTETEDDLDGICEIAANIIEINKKYNGPKAVSYTHLDVYKRQPANWALRVRREFPSFGLYRLLWNLSSGYAGRIFESA